MLRQRACLVFGALLAACSARGINTGWIPLDPDASTGGVDVQIPGVDVQIPGVDVRIPGVDVVIPSVDTGPRPDVPVGPTCTPPQFSCSGRCVNLLTDVANCGACGRACPSGQSCAAGNCAPAGVCNPPLTMCATCTNTRTDPQNCGICGLACAAGQACVNGTCESGPTCAPPRVMCGASCVDVLTNTAHCGGCSRACASGQNCVNGTCSTGALDYSAVATGRRCAADTDCAGGQTCITTAQGRICTNQDLCTQGARAAEEAECGGRGSTCLLYGTTAMNEPLDICLRGCVPTATTERLGACPAGSVCTTNWLAQPMGSTEASPGCLPHCTNDSHCAGVVLGDAGSMRCNVRTGRCAAAPSNPALRADGAACDPSNTTTPQCRGICFLLSSTNRTQGLCGSFIDLRATQQCPDYPVDQMAPRAPMGDNLGVCIFRDCARNAECGGGLVCVYPEDNTGMVRRDLPSSCGYATTRQPGGIP